MPVREVGYFTEAIMPSGIFPGIFEDNFRDWLQTDDQVLALQRADFVQQIGGDYIDTLISGNVPQLTKIELVSLSEGYKHLLHNSAVQLLVNTQDQDRRNNFQASITNLWIERIAQGRTGLANIQATREYCQNHVTLGFVKFRCRTEFHDPHRIRLHPGWWGLFSFSPCSRLDKGLHAVTPDEQVFRDVFFPLDQADPKYPTYGDQYPVYEFAPPDLRNAPEPQCNDGVFFHRCRAHGRVDFLIHHLNTPQGNESRQMVISTKGVGVDVDTLPDSMQAYLPNEFDWQTPSNELPFFCAPHAADETHATIGYLSETRQAEGNLPRIPGEDVQATMNGFRHMYEHVVRLSTQVGEGQAHEHQLIRRLPQCFVQPYAYVQLTNLDAHRVRNPIGQNHNNLHGDGLLHWGFPCQLVYVAPLETSLRLCKVAANTGNQNYEYGSDALELIEWHRCLDGIPVSEEKVAFIDHDLRTVLSIPEGDLEPEHEAIKQRLILAYRASLGLMCSLMAFISAGYTAGPALNSGFNGRNFSSGPRDSLLWKRVDPTSADPLARNFVEDLQVARDCLLKSVGQTPAISEVLDTTDYLAQSRTAQLAAYNNTQPPPQPGAFRFSSGLITGDERWRDRLTQLSQNDQITTDRLELLRNLQTVATELYEPELAAVFQQGIIYVEHSHI